MLSIIEFLLRLRYGNSSVVLGDVMEEYTMGDRSVGWVWRQLFSGYFPGAFSSLTQDIRYAFRSIARAPGFAGVAVITIALGIGVNAGIFSLMNAAALRPLPVPDAGKLVGVYQIFQGKRSRSVNGEESLFSTSEYQTYRDSNHVFGGVLAYSPVLQATLGGDNPKQYVGQFTSCNYFDVLSENPVQGRGFAQSECAAAGEGAVAVISDDMWRTALASDPQIVGKKIFLNRQPFTVIGVARAGFHGTEAVFSSLWVPMTVQPVLNSASPRTYGNPNMSWLVMLGKLKAGESIAQVRADLAVIAAGIDRLYPGRTTKLAIDTATFASMPEARMIVAGVGGVILAAVGMVLLIVCANLANLLLARGVGRQKEIAVRLSVGATRWRLIRQLMTENLTIALAGGALGCVAALWGFPLILQIIMGHLPKDVPEFALNLGPDVRVLGFSLAMTLLTGLAFGLVPALRVTKLNPGRIADDRGGGKLRGLLVGAQVAVGMVLLIASGLMLHALYAAQTVDPGFEMKNIATLSFNLENQGFKAPQAIAFQREVMDRIAAIPGVDLVAQARVTPLSDMHVGTGLMPAGQNVDIQVEQNWVTPEYFSMLGIPMVRGRNFAAGEAGVAIVTESTARRMWAGEDAIGKALTNEDHEMYRVVGVARDAQVSHLGRSNETYVYLPAAPEDQMRMQLLVHSQVPALGALRSSVRSVDPNLAVEIGMLEENLEWWRTSSRIVGILAGSLGAIALQLAAMGIYSMTAFAVSRRAREIGIRMALGADAASVRGLIVRQSMRPVLIGAVIGIAGCAGVSQILKSMLFGVSAYDPIAFAGVPVVLIGIAMWASVMPARRAVRVDPVVALRCE